MDLKEWIETYSQKVFAILVVIQVLFLLGLLGADISLNLAKSGAVGVPLDDYYKWSLLIYFQVSECYYVFHAIYRANVVELFAFILIEFVTLGAAAVRFISINTSAIQSSSSSTSELVEDIFNYIYLGYAASLFILSCICYNSFYEVFAYRNVMKVGANMELQRLYKDYCSFNTIIKLYFQLSLSTFLSFFFFFDRVDWYWYAIDVMAIMIQLVSFAFGYLGLKREDRTLIYIYFGSIVFVQMYIFAKAVFFIVGCTTTNLHYFDSIQCQLGTSTSSTTQYDQGPDIYTYVIIGLTTLACVVLITADFVFAFKCMDGFNQGLKDLLASAALDQPTQEQELEQSSGSLR